MAIASFEIKQVILHQISQKGGESTEAILSHRPTPLSERDKLYVERRMKDALNRRARLVEEEAGVSEVPEIIRKHLSDQHADLVKQSQALARKLQATQPAISSPGILIVADVEVSGCPAIVIAKVEHEEGIRAQEITTDQGQTTFTVEFLRDLLFTSASKVYKVALFSSADVNDTNFRGMVADSQAAGSEIARYFLNTYLGCRLVERPEVVTQRFYEGAQRWINSLKDSEKKTAYLVALLSEMRSNKTTLSVDSFAQDHLLVEDRDAFRSQMQSESVPLRQIDKSIDLVRANLRKVRIDTKGDVLIMAPPDALDDGRITIYDRPEGGTEIRVLDEFKKISGSGKYSP
ncbi:nucleoid-associated protein [Nonomuraea sp. B10E15]|uniref:nucleoid-associated protein n=1 Tax=Nonomuraea sp. B10E15 TaxID=3153560 RepID=UPI00325C7660